MITNFKRGSSSKKSLNIGELRKISVPMFMEIDELPPGTYKVFAEDGYKTFLEFNGTSSALQLSFWKNEDPFAPLGYSVSQYPIIIDVDIKKWLADSRVYQIQKIR